MYVSYLLFRRIPINKKILKIESIYSERYKFELYSKKQPNQVTSNIRFSHKPNHIFEFSKTPWRIIKEDVNDYEYIRNYLRRNYFSYFDLYPKNATLCINNDYGNYKLY